jgi:ABC-2 type transport system permease protein
MKWELSVKIKFPAIHRLRLFGLVIKETIQMVRDPSSILIAFVLPAILLFIFGFGVSLDITNIKLGVVIEHPDELNDQFVHTLSDSKWFDVTLGHQRDQFASELVAGNLSGIVVLSQPFSARITGQRPAQIQIITDGSVPNTAHFVENFVTSSITQRYLENMKNNGQPVPTVIQLEPRFWYNPELVSRYFLVPGAIAIIMTLIGTFLTALLVAREWERGTMEALMATPVTLLEIVLGKLIPYFCLGMLAMAFSVFLSVILFGVPFRGSILLLTVASAAYLTAMLALGLLISTLTRNQFLATQLSQLTAFLPSFLLSGFIFEINSMPTVIQLFSHLIPARYFVETLQTLFMAGNIYAIVIPDCLVMLLMATLLFALTAKKTRMRLE